MFAEGTDFDAVYETPAGPIWVSGIVAVEGRDLFLREFLVYPATASRLHVGDAAMREIFRALEMEARTQGFARCIVSAERKVPGKPRRIISVVRNLR